MPRSQTNWLYALSSGPQARFWDTPFSELSIPERVFATVWAIDGQVCNGGFWQYYFNDAGDNAHFAPDALRALGADATAQIVDEANTVFGASGPPPQRESRQLAIEGLGASALASWSQLDDRFLEKPDDLEQLLANYVLANKSEIRGAP